MNGITPKQYCENKTKQESTPFKIVGASGYYVVNGELIPMDEFEAACPIDLPIRTKLYKGKNPDGTRVE